MQIKSKSNLKLVLIIFSVLNFEASSSGRSMWEKKPGRLLKQCLFFIFIVIIFPKNKLTRDLFIVFHSGRSDIWCPSVVSDTSSSSAFFYGLTTRICSVSVLCWHTGFLLCCLEPDSVQENFSVQHRKMSTDPNLLFKGQERFRQATEWLWHSLKESEFSLESLSHDTQGEWRRLVRFHADSGGVICGCCQKAAPV